MLGHAPLGVLALGQIPGIDAVASGEVLPLNLAIEAGSATGEIAEGNASAPGALLPLTITLDAGIATGEQTITVIGGGRTILLRQDAVAPGALLDLTISVRPGRSAVSVAARGAVLVLRTGIEPGGATGFNGVAYDNEFLLLADAA
jgi:hypothetical protein